MFDEIASFPALLAAAERAVRGKRERWDAAAFFGHLERNLIRLTDQLQAGVWTPGPYRVIWVREPKLRQISIAPFADRVVHQAIHAVAGAHLAHSYIGDTYASLKGRGQHRAICRYEHFRERYPYVLRADLWRYFPSIDHAILKAALEKALPCARTRALLARIIDGSNEQVRCDWLFAGDDLLTPLERRRGLPLGNLTSQMLGNFFLDRFDHFVKERLRVKGYVRYLDDFALFGRSPAELLTWRQQGEDFLARRRLKLHPEKTRIEACSAPTTFLGYVLLPGGRRHLSDANVSRAAARIQAWRQVWRAGDGDEAAVRQSISGWLAHARFAHSRGLRDKWFPRGWFAERTLA